MARRRHAPAQRRARIERELREAPVHYIMARPAYITGDDREESRPTERLIAGVLDAMLALVRQLGARSVANRWGSITGTSLAHGLVRLALDPAAVNLEVYSDRLRG